MLRQQLEREQCYRDSIPWLKTYGHLQMYSRDPEVLSSLFQNRCVYLLAPISSTPSIFNPTHDPTHPPSSSTQASSMHAPIPAPHHPPHHCHR